MIPMLAALIGFFVVTFCSIGVAAIMNAFAQYEGELEQAKETLRVYNAPRMDLDAMPEYVEPEPSGPEYDLAKQEHEELSEDFIRFMIDKGELYHPDDCPPCQVLRSSND